MFRDWVIWALLFVYYLLCLIYILVKEDEGWYKGRAVKRLHLIVMVIPFGAILLFVYWIALQFWKLLNWVYRYWNLPYTGD